MDTLTYFNNNKNIGLWTHYNRIIKENGVIVLFANGMFTADMMESNKKMWKYNLVWEKTQPTGFQNANRMPMRNHEDICVFYKKQPTYNPQKTTGFAKSVTNLIFVDVCLLRLQNIYIRIIIHLRELNIRQQNLCIRRHM